MSKCWLSRRGAEAWNGRTCAGRREEDATNGRCSHLGAQGDCLAGRQHTAPSTGVEGNILRAGRAPIRGRVVAMTWFCGGGQVDVLSTAARGSERCLPVAPYRGTALTRLVPEAPRYWVLGFLDYATTGSRLCSANQRYGPVGPSSGRPAADHWVHVFRRGRLRNGTVALLEGKSTSRRRIAPCNLIQITYDASISRREGLWCLQVLAQVCRVQVIILTPVAYDARSRDYGGLPPQLKTRRSRDSGLFSSFLFSPTFHSMEQRKYQLSVFSIHWCEARRSVGCSQDHWL